MGKGDGVRLVFGWHGMLPSGEGRKKLTQATELDTHLTQKATLEKARALAEKMTRRRKVKPQQTAAERKAENKARAQARLAAKKVTIERRLKGHSQAKKTILRPTDRKADGSPASQSKQ